MSAREEEHTDRPSLEERHANSWGATTVNKKLRNEVFNDAFLKQPIAVQKHRKGFQRSLPRRSLQHILRPANSDPSLLASQVEEEDTTPQMTVSARRQFPPSKSDLRMVSSALDVPDDNVQDITGTSAPEPEIMAEQSHAEKKKRRYSGSALRRKPKDLRESRGNLIYVEAADDTGRGGVEQNDGSSTPIVRKHGSGTDSSGRLEDAVVAPWNDPLEATDLPVPSPSVELSKITRPPNPKEAQTQHDSRVEYFLLLEDLTAGMKRPCIMDLKMGTRQYGVEANPKKQKSQQRKCANTTSRQLGVRVCGLQVWDAKLQKYIFKDKYYGRDIKAGDEFQNALACFLYDGVDKSSILRHIPTVLQKLSQLEVIIRRLRGYRFYAASLLMFYDGGESSDSASAYDTALDDSTTDFATDNEDMPSQHRNGRRSRRNKHEIDFKMADFANSVTAGDFAKDRPCPPAHPNEPDRGFLKGLRSLRRYFLKIQRETRTELGMAAAQRRSGQIDEDSEDIDFDDDSEDGNESE